MNRRNRDTRRAMIVALAVAAAGLFVLVLWLALTAMDFGAAPGLMELAFAVVLVATGLAFWHAFELVGRHFKDLERLRGAVVSLAGNRGAVLPVRIPGEGGAEVGRLQAAIVDLVARDVAARAAPDQRLAAVLASITEAIVVITDQGQVSLVNYPAKVLLDAERVRVGTSVFAALEREPVVGAVERARQAGRPLAVTLRSVGGAEWPAKVAHLGEHGGAVLSFPGEGVEHRAEMEHDLELHDRPPVAAAVGDATPLLELPVTVLDTETTGLDAARDRIVSIGAVRLHGARIYHSVAFDRLVRPGVSIPQSSMAVHGITDAMVAEAADFPEVFAELGPMIENTVLVGHNVAFDLAMFRRECARAGLSWDPPPTLDTLALAVALDPDLPGFDLEVLADYFGVDVHGRHTALGDSLVTAGIYQRLLPCLLDAGVANLGEAQAFSRRATQVLAHQKAAGWWSDARERFPPGG